MDVLLPLIDTEKLASQQQARQPALLFWKAYILITKYAFSINTSLV